MWKCLPAIPCLFILLPAEAQEPREWKNVTEVSCEGIYKCPTSEMMQSLVGKTLRYRSYSFKDDGFVYLALGKDGKADVKHDKKSGSGSCSIKANVISCKTNGMGDFAMAIVQIESPLFVWLNPDEQAATLMPMAVMP